MTSPNYEAVVIGGGVAGIYQIKRLADMGINAVVLEAGSDLGGTWFWNRYPGARFDSESYTYGYSFSQELLDEWDWKERFSGQPENLRYLNYVADKFDLRQHMRFNSRVAAMAFDSENHMWRLQIEKTGQSDDSQPQSEEITARFVLSGLGLLSAPTPPRIEGMEDFTGDSFHTFYWPHEPVDLNEKRVAVIGTGATGIQVIGEIADKVGSLTVFQRRPNWSAPLNNSTISEQEMNEIRARYDEIFARCEATPGGFEHAPDRTGFYNASSEERIAKWDKLYDEPGFGIWLANYAEIFMDEDANAELSEYIADRIRGRVDDPEVAEKLIPRDHGFGVQRVPMETNYFEAFNQDNVELVDISETPIQRITTTGIETSDAEFEFDIIVYATGFDAMTGSFDRIDIEGLNGEKLRDRWQDGPTTFLGGQISGYPNFLMLAGPQSGSASANFPRGIELSVDWMTELLGYMWDQGHTYLDATPEAEEEWTEHVAEMYKAMLMRNAKSWFTGYNSNVEGHEEGRVRYFVYNGGAPKYRRRLQQVAESGYEGIEFGSLAPAEAVEATASS